MVDLKSVCLVSLRAARTAPSPRRTGLSESRPSLGRRDRPSATACAGQACLAPLAGRAAPAGRGGAGAGEARIVADVDQQVQIAGGAAPGLALTGDADACAAAGAGRGLHLESAPGAAGLSGRGVGG